MTIVQLGYTFAKTHGVLLHLPEDADAVPICRHLPEAHLSALVEAQRVAGQLIKFESVDPVTFDAALSASYRDSASEAVQMANDVRDDLSALAETAASVDDLLDQKDDAPVVRLINALLL